MNGFIRLPCTKNGDKIEAQLQEGGRQFAEKCIVELQSRGCDPMLLFLIRHEDLLKKTVFGREMLQFFRSQGLVGSIYDDHYFSGGFFWRMRAEANKGINAINPDNFVEDYGEGGKQRAIEKLQKVQWSKPFQTFCFQTRGFGYSRFVIAKTFPDGLAMLKDVYAAASREQKAVQLLEHAWGDERICRMLIDFELEEHKIAGRFTKEQAEKMACDFPRWFVDRLRDIGAVSKTAEVRAVVKNKSRQTDKGYKVSYHFVFNLIGTYADQHCPAARGAIQPWKDKLELIRSTRSFACLDAEDLKLPVWGVDFGVLHGSQGFSTLLSRKTSADPLPSVDYYVRVMNPPYVPRFADEPGDSVLEKQRYPWAHTSKPADALESKHMLAALYTACYTPPTADSVEYLEGFSRSTVSRGLRQEQARGATPNPLIQRSRSATALPPFMTQSLRQLSTQENKEYTAMQCLDGVLASLVRHFPETAGDKGAYNVSRVSACPCPVKLALVKPLLHIHSSNGVYVVSRQGNPDEVYLACSSCKLVFTPSAHVDVVRGTDGARYSWFRFDRRTWNDIITLANAGAAKLPDTKRRKT